MVRNTMLATVFGVLLSTTAIYAQDLGEEKAIRFEPSVQVLGLENGGMTITKPGETTPIAAVSYKAYPYNSVFTLNPGVKCRLRFSDLSYVIVTGPAKVTPVASDVFKKIVLNVERGDFEISVDERAQAGQFSVVTPMGSFTSLKGTSQLYVGDLTKGTIEEDDFTFRTMSGSAVFGGMHYAMKDMPQANAFRTTETAMKTAKGKEFRDTRLVGVSGEVKTTLPMGGDSVVDLGVSPGTIVKITRARQPGSDNWVVSVLTLFANGVAQNYFCYVEGRSAEYATGELLAEVLPEDEEAEDGDEEDLDGESDEDGMDDLGDDELY